MAGVGMVSFSNKSDGLEKEWKEMQAPYPSPLRNFITGDSGESNA
mgnify:CR=1 FL=1